MSRALACCLSVAFALLLAAAIVYVHFNEQRAADTGKQIESLLQDAAQLNQKSKISAQTLAYTLARRSTEVNASSCHKLEIKELVSVRDVFSRLGHGEPRTGTTPVYRRGHYPYRECRYKPDGRRLRLRPIAALMVADRNFATVIPSWAAQLRRANVTCVLGNIGADELPCATAERFGCLCLRDADTNKSVAFGEDRAGTSQFGGRRGYSVRQRFHFAMTLMAMKYSVRSSYTVHSVHRDPSALQC